MEKWLQGFRDSDFIVTDSFHACVFSIIYKKPFVVLANSYSGLSRIESLLSTFGLEDRFIRNGHDLNVDALMKNVIDYNKVYGILNEWRFKSMKFLIDAISAN